MCRYVAAARDREYKVILGARHLGFWLVLLLPLASNAAENGGLDLLREHIAFVESTYQKWLYLGGVVSALLLGLVTFFGWRTKREVEELVERRFESEADRRIRAKLEAFMETINDELRPRIAELAHTIDELTEQAERTGEGSADAIAQISEDLVRLREAVAALEQKANIPEARRLGAQSLADDEREERDRMYWERLIYALMHHKYVWRSLERLALAAGTSPQEAERVLRQHAEEVVISRGKSGRMIARHVSRKPT